MLPQILQYYFDLSFSNLIGFTYPAFATLQCISSKAVLAPLRLSAAPLDCRSFWLIYWTIWSSLAVLESGWYNYCSISHMYLPDFSFLLLLFPHPSCPGHAAFLAAVVYWIPHYFPIKILFLLWCMLPQFQVNYFLSIISPTSHPE